VRRVLPRSRRAPSSRDRVGAIRLGARNSGKRFENRRLEIERIGFADGVMRALSQSPADRYGSIREMAEDCQLWSLAA